MRLWSIHPRYYDRQALVACWREGLLAQAVVTDPNRGYSHHPQLRRFQLSADPRGSIGNYLSAIVDEADARGYRFARDKILDPGPVAHLTVTDGQIEYEWAHLRGKLQHRSRDVWQRWQTVAIPDPHPLFRVVTGPVEDWEKIPRELSAESRD